MSRVRKPRNKYMNETHYDNSIYGPSKMVRVHVEGEDYRKSDSISLWLFRKYDMKYKTYRNKSKDTRDRIRAEYEADTKEYREAKIETSEFQNIDTVSINMMDCRVE